MGLRACAYIYIRQLSSFRETTLWLIDLTVADCHIRFTFLSLCRYLSREKRTKDENTLSYHMKMAADVNTCAQRITTVKASLSHL